MPTIESMNRELSPEELGVKFNSEDTWSFEKYLRQQVKANPSIRFNIVANWVSVGKARAAKGILDSDASKYHIDSITIRATRQQFEEDVNAFMSGVKWEEI
ncbi:MAG: hypothetical protein Q8K40_01830 [Ignavibacteria bacterium]|nr:hypothetical protein [Ignavibacteria bacterium]